MRLARNARRPALRAAFCAALCAGAIPVGLLAQSPANDTEAAAIAGEPQASELRPGAWWSVTLSAASARFTCDICQQSRDLGPALDVVVGAYAGPGVRVGLEGGLWIHEQEEVRESVYRAGLLAEFRLRPGSRFHLLAGLGWSGYRAAAFDYDAVRLTVGAGWHLPVGTSWVVGNRVTLDAASFGSLSNESALIASEVGLSVVRFGVYVTRR